MSQSTTNPPTQTVEMSQSTTNKFYQYTSFGETLEFAESLGWEDNAPCAMQDEYSADDADGIEEEALAYIRDQGYLIMFEDDDVEFYAHTRNPRSQDIKED